MSAAGLDTGVVRLGGQDVPVTADGAIPAGVLEAFAAYDAALLGNDVAVLDDLFERGHGTVRGDGESVLVGWESIRDFRAARSAVPTRRVSRVHVRVLGEDLALVVASVASRRGRAGQQTQVWRRRDDGWRVAGAHVTAPPAAFDAAVWRCVGAPLVRASGRGALSGHGVAVKDLFAVAGFPVGAGVAAYLAEASTETADADAVARLRAAGADVVGIARTDQFAYSIAGINSDYGTPVNPVAPARIPGGSSSGPAVAVARGEASIGLGTDTAGSIRVPSSFQGLWGFRPTHGAVCVAGLLPLAPSFDTVGWMTRDAGALGAAGDALLPADSSSDTGRFAIAPALLAPAAEAVARETGRIAREIDAETLSWEPALEDWFAAFRTVQAAEAWRAHGPWITSHPGELGEGVAERFADASTVGAAEENAARAVLDEARREVRDRLDGRILILPSTAGLPPSVGAGAAEVNDERGRTLRLTCLASLAGLPVVSAPVLPLGGLRLGLSFIGNRGSDRGLIDAIAALCG